MEDYVRVHSLASIARSSFQIYRRHFAMLLAAVLIPSAPVLLVQFLAGHTSFRWVSLFFLVLVAFFSVVPTTVMISDICVGNEPSLWRAYGRALGKLTGRVMLTVLTVSLILVGGFLLLVVPGILFALWYWFAVVVVVLERASIRLSLKRSRYLGKGYYLRNVGIYIVTSLIGATPIYLLIVGAAVFGAIIELPEHQLEVLGNLLGTLAGPPGAVAVVLLYYDMRVRKEAYDSTKLAEDLRR